MPLNLALTIVYLSTGLALSALARFCVHHAATRRTSLGTR